MMESDKSTKKVLMEVALVAEVLQQYHSNLMGGHSGVNNTLSRISQYYSWSGMKQDVTDYVVPPIMLSTVPPTFAPTLGTERKADISDVILVSDTPRETRRMEVPVTK